MAMVGGNNTISFGGTGPGIYPFNRGNLVTILQQAFRQAHGLANNNPVLLPRRFVFKTHLPLSCDQIRNRWIAAPAYPNYKNSICSVRWQAIQDPYGSGKVHFLSHDEEYIIKTLQTNQYKTLKRILPRFLAHVSINNRTLLPIFCGLYSYKAGGKTIRFVVMNNLLPTNIYIDTRYDLKGTTNRRRSNRVCKDRDFAERYPQGLTLDQQYAADLLTLLNNDSTLLRQLGLTNYSLFLGAHDVAVNAIGDAMRVDANSIRGHTRIRQSLGLLGHRQQGVKGQATPRTVLLYIGIIDVLQPYNAKKQVENVFNFIRRRNDASVKPPREFQDRMQLNFAGTWFR